MAVSCEQQTPQGNLCRHNFGWITPVMSCIIGKRRDLSETDRGSGQIGQKDSRMQLTALNEACIEMINGNCVRGRQLRECCF